MSVSVAIPNATRQLGEGPHWEDITGTLMFVDSLEQQVFKWNAVNKEVSSVKLDGPVGSAVPCLNGGYLVGLCRTISHLDWETGVAKKLHEVNPKGFNDRFNDGKCDPAGRFWTGTRKVEAFTYDVTSGEISDRRDAVNFNNFPDKDAMGWPDGMTIDTDDPVTGTKLREVNIPAPRTTSCCFGGKHMDELYVTTATLRALEDELNKYPLCGSVFKVTELGVKGYPAANVYRSIATSGL